MLNSCLGNRDARRLYIGMIFFSLSQPAARRGGSCRATSHSPHEASCRQPLGVRMRGVVAATILPGELSSDLEGFGQGGRESSRLQQHRDRQMEGAASEPSRFRKEAAAGKPHPWVFQPYQAEPRALWNREGMGQFWGPQKQVVIIIGVGPPRGDWTTQLGRQSDIPLCYHWNENKVGRTSPRARGRSEPRPELRLKTDIPPIGMPWRGQWEVGATAAVPRLLKEYLLPPSPYLPTCPPAPGIHPSIHPLFFNSTPAFMPEWFEELPGRPLLRMTQLQNRVPVAILHRGQPPPF